VLIVADALRPDYLGCYGGPVGISPNVDSLAASSVLFLRGYATAPWTIPSCTSMFTSTYPSRHGLVVLPDKEGFRALSPDAVTLAENMAAEGYNTVAVSAQPMISAEFGFDQGFDHFGIVSSIGDSLSASEVTSCAVEILKRSAGRVFMYVHYVDTHIPYCPPQAFLTGTPPPAGRFAVTVGAEPGLQVALATQVAESDGPTDEEVSYLRWLYQGSVRYLDFEIGNLLRGIRACGRWNGCLLVFTSDHGESFWEHSELMHGQVLYEEQIRIPLILRLPPGTARRQRYLTPGTRVGEIVSLVELSPTILDAAGRTGLGAASWFRRLPLMPGATYRCYSEATLGLDRVAIIEQKRKLIRHQNGRKELFDLRHDPLETANVVGDYPEDRQRLVSELQVWLSAAQDSGQFVIGAEPSQGTVDQLKALGYLN
jgi:arylsulfatase A-like enzyme